MHDKPGARWWCRQIQMEPMSTIDPPPVFALCSAASFVPRNTLVWLTAMIRSQPSSRSESPTELPKIPALFTKQVGLQYNESAIFVRSTGPSSARGSRRGPVSPRKRATPT
jgi:hypothetical protein